MAQTRRKFSRRELLDLVWSGPMRSIAAELGLSDVGLKKAVMKAGLPTPPQGHWNRVAAGRPVGAKPPLPPRDFGGSDEIWIGAPYWQRYERHGTDDPVPPPPEFDESLEAVRVRAAKAVGKVRLMRDISRCHPAIATVLADEAARADAVKATPWPSPWRAPRYSTPLDQRRLRLLNAISLGLARAGLKVVLQGKDDLIFEIRADSAYLPILARKLVTKGVNASSDKRLSIVAGLSPDKAGGSEARWDDEPERRLEDRLTEITVELVVLIEGRYRRARLNHHASLMQQRAAAIEARRLAEIEAKQKERERLESLRQARLDRLLADATRYRQAQEIRRYVEAVLERHPVIGDSSEAEAVDRWRCWALKQADTLDPIESQTFFQEPDE